MREGKLYNDRISEKCQINPNNISEIVSDKMTENMSGRMPDRMPDRMPEYDR